MQLNLDFFLEDPLYYLVREFIPAIGRLEPDAIALGGILLILIFIFSIFAIKFFAWVLSLFKKFVLFVVIFFSLIVFFIRFQDDLLASPPNYVLIGIGAIGVIFALIALVISLLSIFSQWQKTSQFGKRQIEEELDSVVKDEMSEEMQSTPSVSMAQNPSAGKLVGSSQSASDYAVFPKGDFFNKKIITDNFHDRSVLAVLSYIVVAEFGVFSSVTVHAPSAMVGMGLFASFMLAAFIFIRTSYHHYLVGIRHLIVGTLFGFFLSLLLGHFWAEIPTAILLSQNYFATNSLVAFITGLALSLFMGSKG